MNGKSKNTINRVIALLCSAIFFISGGSCGRVRIKMTPPSLTVKTLGWVRNENGRLVDEFGRQIILKGASAKVDRLFDTSFNDGRLPNEIVPTFDETDARDMARFSFNFIRLTITWSGLEPTEGTFNEAFLHKLDDVLEIARKAGLYVLIDFHEDAYSKEIGEDGAPLWAIIPKPLPSEMPGGPVYEGPGLYCPCYNLDDRRKSSVALNAFSSFFLNTENIQERFMPAWKLIASRYAHLPSVIGFEDMNEPVALHIADGIRLVEDFHDRAVRAMREVNKRHAIWVEPEVVIRNFSAQAPLRQTPFPDDNVVYEAHLYPHLAGINFSTYEGWYGGLTPTFDHLIEEARSWGAAPAIGEWGSDMETQSGADFIDVFNDLANERNVHLAIWSWKGYGSRTDLGHSGGMFRWDYGIEKWLVNQIGVDALSRPYALATPGILKKHFFDRSSNTLTVIFRSRGGEGAPLLYIPQNKYPDGFIVELDGTPVEINRDPETQRGLVPWEGMSGVHTIILRPAY